MSERTDPGAEAAASRRFRLGHPAALLVLVFSLALVIGSEAEGPGPQSAALASGYLSIPMPGAVESLNAAVAAGILLFEVARQRAA